MSKQIKIIGYVRVSSAAQVIDNESLPRQIEQIRSYCQLKGLPEPEIIKDEGISGFKANRPGFQQVVKLCKAKQVKVLIAYDLSRLSRSVRTTLEFIDDVITKHGVELVCLKQSIDTGTASGKAFLAISSVFAQLYRDEISERMKNAWKYKRQKNEKCSGTVPYGYSVVGKQLVPNEYEQSIIRLILELRSQGRTFYEIAKHLDGQCVKTKTGKDTWNHRIICNIVRRESKQQSDKAA